MSAIRKEILDCINGMTDDRLEALKPLLTILADDTLRIETDLTDEEKRIVQNGRKEYRKGGYISVNDL